MSFLRRFAAHRGALVGGIVVVAIVVLAVLAPVFAKDPFARDLERGLGELGAPLGPGADALLGTDQLGRDVLARLLASARTSLGVAFLATLLATSIGVVVGVTAGYAGGRVDLVLMRFVDLALAFPVLILAILLAALLREADLASANAPIVLTLGTVSWTTLARVVRSKTLVIANSEYIAAARALGASAHRVVLRHVMPNVIGTTLAIAVFVFAQNLLAESVLSYVGLGPAPPAPTWGRMLFEGRSYYRMAPHLVIAPALAIVVAVVAFNLVAAGLRDTFDPRARGRGLA